MTRYSLTTLCWPPVIKIVRLLLTGVLAAALARGAPAQVTTTEDDRPRVGLALSGGSAKGLAHIGVLRALEAAGVHVDVVAGTSMGSLIGGLYASGYSVSEIANTARAMEWDALFRDGADSELLALDKRFGAAGTIITFPIRDGKIGLPSGVVRGDRIMRTLQELTWPVRQVSDFRKLPKPFVAVATDLANGEAVTLDAGVLALAMRASMAIPGVFAPVQLNSRLLVDGGIARNLPAQNVRELGADFVICSDVSAPLTKPDNLSSLFEILIQTVSFGMATSTEQQRALCDLVIAPTTAGLSAFDFASVDRWIEEGEKAARAVVPKLRGQMFAAGTRDARPLGADSVYIEALHFRGVSEAAVATARAAAGVDLPRWLNASQLDEMLARLYSTDLFTMAYYHVSNEDRSLTVELVENQSGSFGFGFRYDGHRKASLLLSARLYHLVRYGTVTQLDARLGEQLRVGGRILRGRGVTTRFTRGVEASFTRALFDIYDGDHRVAEINSRVITGGAFAGMAIARSTVAGVGVVGTVASEATSIAPRDTAGRRIYTAILLTVRTNTMDAPEFAMSGTAVNATVEWGSPASAGDDYRLYLLNLDHAWRIASPVVIHTGARFGSVNGSDVPFHKRFFMGGVVTSPVFAETQPAFWGLRPQELNGMAVHVVTVSLRYRLRSSIQLAAGVNAGNVMRQWDWTPDYIGGWGVSLGTITPVGPAFFALTGRHFDRPPRLELSLGPRF